MQQGVVSVGRVGTVGGFIAGGLVCVLALASPLAGATGLVAAENIPVSLQAGASAAGAASMPAVAQADDTPTLVDEAAATVQASLSPAAPRKPGWPGQAADGAMRQPDAYALVVIGLLAVGAGLLRHSRNRQPRGQGTRR